jgi:hypothetical protein
MGRVTWDRRSRGASLAFSLLRLCSASFAGFCLLAGLSSQARAGARDRGGGEVMRIETREAGMVTTHICWKFGD